MSILRPILLIFLGCSSIVSAQKPLDLLLEFRKAHEIPGLFVGVHSGSKSFMWSVGHQGDSDSTQVSKNTLFELGSVSKTFTTLALAEAIAEGNLRWETTVAEMDTRFQNTPIGRLTLLDLVTHRTGGMPLQVPDHIKNEDQWITYLQNWTPELPGARSYANPSIGLAAWLLGQKAGQTFQQWMDSHNFDRWGFTQTFIDIPARQMVHYAVGMGADGKKRRVQPDYLWEEAYGVKSSGQDMMLFVKRLLQPELVQKQKFYHQALMAQRTTYFQHPLFDQGLIWEALPWPLTLERWESTVLNTLALIPMSEDLNSESTKRLYQKTGSTGGFSTYVVWIPSASWGMVMMANKSISNTERVKLAQKMWEATHKKEFK